MIMKQSKKRKITEPGESQSLDDEYNQYDTKIERNAAAADVNTCPPSSDGAAPAPADGVEGKAKEPDVASGVEQQIEAYMLSLLRQRGPVKSC